MTTTNPTLVRGEVWRIRFDPAEGDEIKKVRTAVVSENAIERVSALPHAAESRSEASRTSAARRRG